MIINHEKRILELQDSIIFYNDNSKKWAKISFAFACLTGGLSLVGIFSSNHVVAYLPVGLSGGITFVSFVLTIEQEYRLRKTKKQKTLLESSIKNSEKNKKLPLVKISSDLFKNALAPYLTPHEMVRLTVTSKTTLQWQGVAFSYIARKLNAPRAHHAGQYVQSFFTETQALSIGIGRYPNFSENLPNLRTQTAAMILRYELSQKRYDKYESFFVQAIYNSDAVLVNVFIECSFPMKTMIKDINGRTTIPLGWSIKYNSKCYSALLQATVIQGEILNKHCILHVAVSYSSDTARMEELIKNGANINDQTRTDRQTPLMWAADSSASEALPFLIKKGADLNRQDSVGNTALHYAYKARKLDRVRILIDAGADQTILNNSGILAQNM